MGAYINHGGEPTPQGARAAREVCRAFLITDDDATREAISRLVDAIQDWGCVLTQASLSRALAEGCGSKTPDVILFDCSGAEPLSRIGGRDWGAPIVALASSSDVSFYEEAIRAGAADCIPLPNLTSALLEHAMRGAVRRHRAGASAKTGFDLRRTFLTLADRFGKLDFDNVDQGIRDALEILGAVAGADRAYVFLFREGGTVADNTHEWCADGVEPVMAQLQGMPSSRFPWGMERIQRGDIVVIPRVADMPPEAQPEKDIEQTEGVQSLIVMPMVCRNEVLGFVGFDSVRRENPWPDEIAALLRVMARSFASALVRKRAETALRKREELFREILESSRDVAYKLNLITELYEYVSPSVLEHTGFTAEEFLALGAAGYEERMHPEDWQRLRRIYEDYHRSPGEHPLPTTLEYRVRHKNGEYRWRSDSFTVLRDDAGRDIAEVGTFRDITAQKEAERALRENEAKYRELVQNANSIILRMDTEGRVTFFNEFAQRFFGYSEQEILGRNVVGTIVPPTATDGADLAEMILAIGRDPDRFANNENENMRRNGERVWIVWTNRPIFDAEGKLREVLCVGNDSTARKQTETALRESEERYHKLVDDAYDGICIIQDGVLAFVNPELAVMLRTPAKDLIGAPFTAFLHPDTADEAFGAFDGFLHGMKLDAAYETVLRASDGSRVEVEVSGSLIAYRGRKAGLVTLRDVTERNRSQRLIQEQKLAMVAASRMSALGLMASGVAHEINNPLAIISGSMEQLHDLLVWDPIDRRLALEQCERVMRHAQRIAAIIKGLRAFSRDGSADPFKDASLKEVVEDALDLCSARFEAHGIALDLPAIPDDLRLECRTVQLAQVLINLLANAHDAVEKLPDKWIRLEVADLGDSLQLAIVDSGGGIPPEIREKALQPFFTTKSVGKGVGLGLSIALGIVESHAGTLTIDAQSPNTRVVVQLPKRQPEGTTTGG